MKRELKPGDVVTLRGTPEVKMTISEDLGDGTLVCVWHNAHGEPQLATYTPAALVLEAESQANASAQQLMAANDGLLADVIRLQDLSSSLYAEKSKLLEDVEGALKEARRRYPETGAMSATSAICEAYDRYDTLVKEANEQIAAARAGAP